VAYFMAIDKVKFRKPVLPGDQLIMEIEMLRYRPTSCKMMGTSYVDGEVVCQAEFMAAIVDK
ncbi:UDP-3-O-[3-hydroxymyristoyl] N-acetylglucosamine deacetylase, partial [candidate division KSB1 bacterium]|nr:UDP-3-O-[3-hydroxymyristoyl] N-acetylglucosamine deacetylase [candidate division KSB1 bacterium]